MPITGFIVGSLRNVLGRHCTETAGFYWCRIRRAPEGIGRLAALQYWDA